MVRRFPVAAAGAFLPAPFRRGLSHDRILTNAVLHAGSVFGSPRSTFVGRAWRCASPPRAILRYLRVARHLFFSAGGADYRACVVPPQGTTAHRSSLFCCGRSGLIAPSPPRLPDGWLRSPLRVPGPFLHAA